MPKLVVSGRGKYVGEIRGARETGHSGHSRYIWAACEDCGKERWTRLKGDSKPEFNLCLSCTRKLHFHNPETRLKMSLAKKGKQAWEKHPNWKGGIRKRPEGYIDIKLRPDDFFYPMADHLGYVREHRLIVAKSLGRCLHTWEEVHHKGTKYPRGSREDKGDNRRDNLEIMTKGCHSAEHRQGYQNGYLKGLHDGRLKQIQELKRQIEELRRE